MSKLILVVDDDEMNLKISEFILKKEDYIVSKAKSGMECMNYLEDSKPDLILLDKEMPVMDGIKTLQMIKSKPELADIPVIFLTATADSNTVVEACSLGAIDYIRKPFMPEELIKRVNNVLKE